MCPASSQLLLSVQRQSFSLLFVTLVFISFRRLTIPLSSYNHLIMPATMSTIPQPIQNAIMLLTSPIFLVTRFPPATIEALSRSLHQTMPYLANQQDYSIVFKLSPSRLPPAPLLNACISVGVSWNRWALALHNDKDVVSTMEITPEGLWWTGEGVSPIILRSRPAVKPMEVCEPDVKPIDILAPELSLTPPTPLPIQVENLRASSPGSSFGSPLSSRSSSIFDEIDMGSPLSSVASSPASSRPPSRCHSRSSSYSDPIVDTASLEVQAYKYAGGETKVVGGGVMLCAAPLPRTSARLAARRDMLPVAPPAAPKARGRACSRATTWRSKSTWA
ncbi:hypothetical protein DL96DRAFT_1584895 [Flagelloscypha sp. PMI_526]|nr:hypothetical protein DL96DRAFT_1584895 [Flagelloscypha sp. PMI_526]